MDSLEAHLPELVSAIQRKELLLFVGAGVSRNLMLPLGSDIESFVADQLGYDPDVLRTYGDLQEIVEYYSLLEPTGIGRIRGWIDRKCAKAVMEVGSSRIHELIVALDCPLIYTTNYDPLLEAAYSFHGKPFARVANLPELRRAPAGVTQIVKYHGDLDDDESIVLTETSYFDRLSFQHPLDIKLRADVLGRTVLFIGYSLRDINVRLLLYGVSKLWSEAAYKRWQPKSLIFLARPNPVQEEMVKSLGIAPVVGESSDPEQALGEFMETPCAAVEDVRKAGRAVT